MTAQDYSAPASVGRLQQSALIAGVIGLAASVAGFFVSREQFYHAYIVAFLFVLGLALGSLGLLMLQHLTGGSWGILIRRPLESATRTLPLVFVFFLPIFFGMKYLYSAWITAPPKGAEGALSDLQQKYLTVNGFIIRALIYFAAWMALMWLFNRMSREQDINRGDRSLRRRLKFWAGPGIIIYVLLMTFAAIDWSMSITPKWASTIYGFLFVAGQAISAMSLMIAVVVMLARAGVFGFVGTRHLHDLGKLLFAFVMLWAYFDFSQLLIIWSGNLPEEITFYRARLFGGWGAVAIIVLVFHFFVPFFVLLSSDVKRSTRLLPRVALWMMCLRVVDLYWMTRPELKVNGAPSGPVPTWIDFAAVLALAGLWLWYFAGQLKQQPLLPLGEPKLAEAIGSNEH